MKPTLEPAVLEGLFLAHEARCPQCADTPHMLCAEGRRLLLEWNMACFPAPPRAPGLRRQRVARWFPPRAVAIVGAGGVAVGILLGYIVARIWGLG